MTEFVAVVGSRQGADLEHVERFVRALYRRQPSSVLVSGGAQGVDKLAETTWLGLGGRVWSYRPKQLSRSPRGLPLIAKSSFTQHVRRSPVDAQDTAGNGFAGCPVGLGSATGTSYGIELWRLGEFPPTVGILTHEPTWADYRGAALYRNMLIAEKADRVVAFYRRHKSGGTMHTIDACHGERTPFYEYEAAA